MKNNTSYPTIIDKINLQVEVNRLQLKEQKKSSPEGYLLAGQNSALSWVLTLLDDPIVTVARCPNCGEINTVRKAWKVSENKYRYLCIGCRTPLVYDSSPTTIIDE